MNNSVVTAMETDSKPEEFPPAIIEEPSANDTPSQSAQEEPKEEPPKSEPQAESVQKDIQKGDESIDDKTIVEPTKIEPKTEESPELSKASVAEETASLPTVSGVKVEDEKLIITENTLVDDKKAISIESDIVAASKEENLTSAANMEKAASTKSGVEKINDSKLTKEHREVAINGLIARVDLIKYNLDERLVKYKQSLVQKGVKRKTLDESGEEDLNASSELVNKKRLKADEEVDASGESEAEASAPTPVKKRGRPRKNPPQGEPAKPVKKTIEKKVFNGEKTERSFAAVSFTKSRRIKPNPRLQDFVVSSTVRYYSQSPNSGSPSAQQTSRKRKAGDSSDDVRSFLPKNDEPNYSDSDEEEPVKPASEVKGKENKIDNVQAHRRPGRPPGSTNSPSTPRRTDTFKIKPLQSFRTRSAADVKLRQYPPKISPNKVKVNGSNVPQQKAKTSEVLPDDPTEIDFNKLVRSLKLVKLPGPNWKIRIVVSKQQTITEVTFTNKEVNERCIKFSRITEGFIITFGKSLVKLLGAPTKIYSLDDVTILLDIVHNLTVNDPVLEYSSRCN